MSNYNKKKGVSLSTVIAIILAIVLVVGAVLGIGYHFGWFDKVETEETDEASIENVVVNEGASTARLSISSARTASLTSSSITNGNGESAEYVEDSITLTANYNSDATYPKFTWTCTDTTNITLTPSSDTKTCVVTCNNAFSTQATITCTADDSGESATCTVDYIKRATAASLGFSITLGSSSFLTTGTIGSSTDGTTTWTLAEDDLTSSLTNNLTYGDLSVTYGTGTLTETYTLTWVYFNTDNDSIDLTDVNSRSINNVLNSVTGYAPLSSTSDKVNCYYALKDLYDSGTAAAKIVVMFVGDTTGEWFTYTCNVKINPEAMYTSVTDVDLDHTAITF